MNTTIKIILVIINIFLLGLAIYWYYNPSSNIEPIIVAGSQIISLIVIFVGDGVIKKYNVKNSKNINLGEIKKNKNVHIGDNYDW